MTREARKESELRISKAARILDDVRRKYYPDDDFIKLCVHGNYLVLNDGEAWKMTQEEINRNRDVVSLGLEERRESARLEEIRRQLAEDEDAFRAEVARQMDAGYLFARINGDNRKHDKVPIKLYDADSGAMTSAVEQQPTEWWDEYPCLYSMGVGAGIILGMLIVSQIVLGALGII